MPYNLFIYL